jgi:hypothetical protein
MWMFSKDGFFSVVQNEYCSPGELAVRARCRKDLEAFCRATKTPAKKIIRTPKADYRFRVHVKRELWAAYAAAAAGAIDYPNFKNETCSGDLGRSLAYHGCWASMNNWQDSL